MKRSYASGPTSKLIVPESTTGRTSGRAAIHTPTSAGRGHLSPAHWPPDSLPVDYVIRASRDCLVGAYPLMRRCGGTQDRSCDSGIRTDYSLASMPCPWIRDLEATAGAPFRPLSLTAWANSVPAIASPVIPSSISTVHAIVSDGPDRPNIKPYGTQDNIHSMIPNRSFTT